MDIKRCLYVSLKSLPEDLYDVLAYSIFPVGTEIQRTGAVIAPELLKLYMGEFRISSIEEKLKEIYNKALECNAELIVFS